MQRGVALNLLVLVLICWTSQTSAQGCMGISPYIATAFNVVDYQYSVGYHDMDNFRSLFVNENGDWTLYDFNAGRITTFAGGQCGYYSNSGLYLDMNALASQTTNFVDPDFYGWQGMGYTIEQNGVTIRGILDMQGCTEILTYIAINRVPYTIIIRDNIRTDNVDQEIRNQVDPVVNYINTGVCFSIGLPY